jgi:putative toxin-antitoxin system antitoxin component (TIGR02293 family)
MATWSPLVLEIAPPKNPGALSDVLPLLERLDAAFGTSAVAKLLDVGSGTVTNWKKGRHTISPEYAQRVIELHDVLVRALQIFQPQIAMDWLVGAEPFLDGARPIDVLVSRGAAPLIDALAAIEATAYA